MLADKPWLIAASDFPKLERVLALAREKRLVAYDVMTERSEITTILQRELAQDAEVAGEVGPGSESQPAFEMESVHHILKLVAGAPNLRPAWFFDTEQQGEALVGRGHAPGGPRALAALPGAADRLPLRGARAVGPPLADAALERGAGARDRPEAAPAGADGEACRTSGSTTSQTARRRSRVRGVHARVKVLWNYEAPAGAGDTHTGSVRGGLARIDVLQGPEQKWRPELYVVPNRAADTPQVRAALSRRVAALAEARPGLAVLDEGTRLRVVVPDRYRVGHEPHFAEVTGRFLGYLKDPATLPAWEAANMLAKYRVTTEAVELSRR